jgi:predicted Zn-dependent protease
MKRAVLLALVLSAGGLAGCETVDTTKPGVVGVDRNQRMLVSAEDFNKAAEQAYAQTLADAQKKGTLDRDPAQVQRIKTIVGRLTPQTASFRQDAPGWKWETHVLSTSEINAWCMPGGKIAVYTGLLDQIKPSDDELAAVIGHEMAHALREHSREQASHQMAEQLALNVVGAVANVPDLAVQLAPMVFDVTVNLPHSRTDESEADRIGVELAARAGYDPRAAIALWQRMQQAGGAQPPKLLATHPPTADRIKELQAVSEKLVPVYEQAKAGGSSSAGK